MSPGAPYWIGDHELIQRLLHRFIDMCEAENRKRFSVKITKTKWQELYDFSNQNHADLWRIIEQFLHDEYGIIKSIRLKKNHEPVYDQAILDLESSQEALVRNWLSRPKTLSYRQQWLLALNDFPQFASTSLAQEIRSNSVIPRDILSGFSAVRGVINDLIQARETLSLRSLSARCFWGDSKFLDNRRALIYDVFPEARQVIHNRTIMMSAYVPSVLKRAIFVENFDSFLTLVEAIKLTRAWQECAIIYSAGYRGSASTIRIRGESQFLTINMASETAIADFHSWWYRESTERVECYFWGDLDFEGLKILKALRLNFEHIQAWQPGYDLMVDYHEQGMSHSPEQTNKQNQLEPGLSQCRYADTVLRPLLLSSQRFVDQEIVNKSQLQNILMKG